MTKFEEFDEKKRTMSSSRCIRMTAGDRLLRRYRRAMIRRAEYIKLKAIVPSVARMKSVTKLTVIEEAIKYINELHAALVDKLIDTPSDTDLSKLPTSLFYPPAELFLNQLFQLNNKTSGQFSTLSNQPRLNISQKSRTGVTSLTLHPHVSLTCLTSPLASVARQSHHSTSFTSNDLECLNRTIPENGTECTASRNVTRKPLADVKL